MSNEYSDYKSYKFKIKYDMIHSSVSLTGILTFNKISLRKIHWQIPGFFLNIMHWNQFLRKKVFFLIVDLINRYI